MTKFVAFKSQPPGVVVCYLQKRHPLCRPYLLFHQGHALMYATLQKEYRNEKYNC